MNTNFTVVIVTVIICATVLGGLFIYFTNNDQGPIDSIETSPTENMEEGSEISVDTQPEDQPSDVPPETVFCTQDVLECPDGTYVSRVAPECNFEACPAETNEEESDNPEDVACTMDVKECSDGSYVSRQPPNCEFEQCPTTPSGNMQLQLAP